MTATSTTVVLDSSVSVKWFLADEPDHDIAWALLRAWSGGQIALVEPAVLWSWEMGNVIRRAVVQNRLDAREGRKHVRAIAWMAKLATRIDLEPLLESVYEEAQHLNVALYDLAYARVAEQHGLELVTADERLARALQPHKGFVTLMRDYSPPAPEFDVP